MQLSKTNVALTINAFHSDIIKRCRKGRTNRD